MLINEKDISLNEAIKIANVSTEIIKRRENGLILSDHQVNVLKNNNIDYLNYSNFHDLVFSIEEALDENYDEELNNVSIQLSDYSYYYESKK